MRKRVILFLCFTLSIFIIDRGIAFKMDSLYQNNYCANSGGGLNYYLKFQKADTLFIGSSRVKTMIISDVIGKNVLNITANGKHFYYQASVIHLLEQYNKLPKKMIVLNLEAEDIYKECESELINEVFYLKYYYDKNAFVKNVIDSKSPFEKYKFLMSSYKFNGENFLLFTNQFQHICDDNHNSYQLLKPKKSDSSKVINAIKENNKLKSKEVNSHFFEILKSIDTLCKRDKIKLVILYGPHYVYLKRHESASLIMQGFCKKNRISYLDFNTKKTTQFKNIHCWSDILHLNKDAALVYTKLIEEELNKL